MYIYMSLYDDVTDDANHNHSNDDLICIKILYFSFFSFLVFLTYLRLFHAALLILILRFLTIILLI